MVLFVIKVRLMKERGMFSLFFLGNGEIYIFISYLC